MILAEHEAAKAILFRKEKLAVLSKCLSDYNSTVLEGVG